MPHGRDSKTWDSVDLARMQSRMTYWTDLPWVGSDRHRPRVSERPRHPKPISADLRLLHGQTFSLLDSSMKAMGMLPLIYSLLTKFCRLSILEPTAHNPTGGT